MVNFRVLEDTQCTMCGKVLWYGEVVHHNDNYTEYMCSPCYDKIVAIGQDLEPTEPYLGHDEADALARQWADGQIAPEDFDPRIQWWQSEEAVDEAIRLGYVHRKQRSQEIERRRGSGRFSKDAKPFVDQFPSPYQQNEGYKDASRTDSPEASPAEGPEGTIGGE